MMTPVGRFRCLTCGRKTTACTGERPEDGALVISAPPHDMEGGKQCQGGQLVTAFHISGGLLILSSPIWDRDAHNNHPGPVS